MRRDCAHADHHVAGMGRMEAKGERQAECLEERMRRALGERRKGRNKTDTPTGKPYTTPVLGTFRPKHGNSRVTAPRPPYVNKWRGLAS